MIFERVSIIGVLFGAAAVVAAPQAGAAMLGDDDVTFIFDEDQFADSVPTVTGNTLEIALIGGDFRHSESTGAPDEDSVGLFLQIDADPLIRITGVTLFASGEYETNGTTVNAAGSMTLDGFEITATPDAPFDGDTGALTPWSGGAVSGPLNDAFLDVTLQSILTSDGFPGHLAYIDLQFVSLTVDTVVVPLPAAVWLLGSALLGLVTVGRIRK